MMTQYKTHGTCSVQIDVDVDEQGKISYCKIHQGCRGNTQGLSRMVIGRDTDEVKNMLRGIPCRGNTSCPDQLSRAIEQWQEENGK